MIKKLIISTVFALTLTSCNNNPPTQTATSTADATPVTVTSNLPKWQLTVTEDSMAIPHTKIQLIYNETISLKEGTGHFRALEKNEFADKKMPKETLTACSGFWAGLEHQLIIVDSSDTWVVKEKYIDEGSDGTETFETIKVIKK